jgi:hypothetical protein
MNQAPDFTSLKPLDSEDSRILGALICPRLRPRFVVAVEADLTMQSVKTL